jgi:pSer/pThr/pTyr-binding forkhead associated (FHA) protein/Mg-chelatase subunit ChlD
MVRTWMLCIAAALYLLVCGVPAHAQIVATDLSTGSQQTLQQTDIIIVLDNSGSMKKNDPDFLTQEVVTNFLGDLEKNTRLGMVIFDRDARLVEPLADRSGQLAKATFLKSLEKVDYKGQLSDTPCAVERAIYELKTNGRPDAQKVIVLLTDGIVDTGDKLRDVEKEKWLKDALAEESKRDGIRIFGIAFTEAADYSLIQTLAIRTDGEYFRAFSVDDIEYIFNTLHKSLTPVPHVPAEDLPERVQAEAAPAKPIESTQPESTIDQAQKPASQPAPAPAPPAAVASPSSDRPGAKPFYQDKSVLILAAISLGILILLGIILIMLIGNRRAAGQRVKAPIIGKARSKKFPPMPRAELIDIKNVTSRQTIPLTGLITRVGRNDHNEVAIHQETVSSLHATIEYRDGFFYLEDQRSKNKTLLNGMPVAPHSPKKLKNGDEITFNVFKFTFLLPDQIPAGETVLDFRENADTIITPEGSIDEIAAGPKDASSIPQAMLIDMKNVTGKKSFAIKKPKTRIGRGVNNEIAIAETSISGTHAVIEYKDGTYYLEDQRSMNKTRINGEAIEPYSPEKLKSGDEIMFDVFRFIFLLERQLPTGDTGRRWPEE